MDVPEGAKAPQDHKTKKKAKKERMRVEFRGETYRLLDEDVLDDIDVVEALDRQQLTVALRGMLGDAEYERLKENLADENGRTRGSDIVKFFNKMIEQQRDVKN